ncbi:hypothetical protein [Phormidesmis sp. 146-33]
MSSTGGSGEESPTRPGGAIHKGACEEISFSGAAIESNPIPPRRKNETEFQKWCSDRGRPLPRV